MLVIDVTNEDRPTPKPWLMLAILLGIMLVISAALVLFRKNPDSTAQTGQRQPLPSLGYCSSNHMMPCVLSFNLNPDGDMVINILAQRFSQDFYVKIRTDEAESIYACQKTKGFANVVSCTGRTLPLGIAFQFLILATGEDTLLAEGRFPIIGLALATPQVYFTPTPAPSPKRYR